MYVILIGPPGAGKGTQALTLSKRLGVVHVASGDLFRHNLNKETPLGGAPNRFSSSAEKDANKVK